MADTVICSGIVDEAHPEVFDLRAMPPQPKERKPGQLPESKIKQFFEQGYLIVEDFFTREELDVVRVATEGLVEKLAQKLYSAGKIKNLYKECGLFERLTKIDDEFPGANILLHKTGELPQAYRDLWSNERLLNVIEQLLGPDVASSPVWNLRTKTPKNEATVVPWHQDSAYFDNDSYNVLVPTAWIPLLDTDEFNGGMQVVKGGHTSGKIATHQCCHGGTWYVMLEEEEMERSLGLNMARDTVTCPIPYGSFLLFQNATPHRSLPNLSKQVRWALDLRWQRPDKPFGLWGMKKGVVMRSSSDNNVKIDWDTFVSVDRTAVQTDSVKDMDIECDPEFDTTLQGPWMKKWEIVHMNKHTKRHEQMEMAKQ